MNLEGLVKLSKNLGVSKAMQLYTSFENKYYNKHKQQYLTAIQTGNISDYDIRKEKVKQKCLQQYLNNK